MGHFSQKTIANTFKELLAVWASALSYIKWNPSFCSSDSQNQLLGTSFKKTAIL
jgi:hypothetical protein